MKSVGFPILRPLTFKCKILGQFESLKVMKDLYTGWQSLPSSSFFRKSLGNFSNIKITVKCRTLTSVTSKLKSYKFHHALSISDVCFVLLPLFYD